MDGHCGSWPHQQHIDGQTQTPDLNNTGTQSRQYLGLHKHFSSYMDPWHDTVATNKSFSLSLLDEPPQLRFNHPEPHGWFYCLPTFRQAMFLPSNSVLKEHLPVEPQITTKKDENHNAGPQFPQKQFLVFDQMGDKTTMIFCSGIGSPPVHCLSHWKEKQAEASIFQPHQEDPHVMGNSDTLLMDNFIDINEFEEDHGNYIQSEMHEDTEELDALMYSDGDTDCDYDEVTSTGRSPSTLSGHEKQYEFAGFGEEVASSDEEHTKRQKLSHGGKGADLTEGRITLNHGTFGFDDDTESHCGSGNVCDSGRIISLCDKKRSRKDLVRETVSTLQTMIPNGKGATTIEVIDEAINFLMSLKLKAKSLGLDSM
ncbi:hypothetical protein QQ045_032940 [Rhodiola kirilowii]